MVEDKRCDPLAVSVQKYSKSVSTHTLAIAEHEDVVFNQHMPINKMLVPAVGFEFVLICCLFSAYTFNT